MILGKKSRSLEEPRPGVSLFPWVALGHTALFSPSQCRALSWVCSQSHIRGVGRGELWLLLEAPWLQNPSGNHHAPARLLWAASVPALSPV